MLVLSGLLGCCPCAAARRNSRGNVSASDHPHKRIYLVNAAGNHPVGNTDYAPTIWHAAGPSPALVS
jgi:hypothetical protein